MKRKAIIAFAVIGIVSLSSCTRDWDCECKIGSGDTQVVTTKTIEASTLKDARKACEERDDTSWGTCVLKP